MRALKITGRGGPEVLSWEDTADPVPGPGELRVRVQAAGLNRADLLQCLGLYPAPAGAPADIPGLEYAGQVDALGPGSTRFRVGDRVMGLVGGGAFAERLVVHEREALPIPAALGPAHAAAIPEAFATALDALILQAGLRLGETVLIHAVASGVGTAATQLVAAMGARAIGTSRSAAKLARCGEYGLAHGIEVQGSPTRFAEAVLAETAGRGADVVLDLVGGDYLPETLEAAAPRGRIALVGLLAGPSAELALGTVLRKRLHLFGTVLRSRPLEEKVTLARAFERHVLPLLEQGRLRPVIDSIHTAGEFRQAFERLASNQALGKVVLTLDAP